MNPYRQSAKPVEVKHKPRGWLKTLKLKALILWKGKWRHRFLRCHYCRKFVIENDHGWNTDMFFHQMHCLAANLSQREKARENYYFAIAPDPDEDFLGPLR